MMNILLIEPDAKLAYTYVVALEQAGYNVQHAMHAQDAVHSADNKKPDLVVLELQMTAHSGVEFLYEFRSYPEWQNVPVVLLTMVPPTSLQITAAIMTELGIVDCLYKPSTNLAKLIDAISEYE